MPTTEQTTIAQVDLLPYMLPQQLLEHDQIPVHTNKSAQIIDITFRIKFNGNKQLLVQTLIVS